MTGPAEQPPKDTIEKYAAGNAVVATYQTSGVYEKGSEILPSLGQADSYSVVTSTTPIDEAAMNRIMDGLNNLGRTAAGNNPEAVSTGALVSVTQVASAQPGTASFDVVAGSRGDSRTFIATADADNNVSLYDVNRNLKNPANFVGIEGFDAFSEAGANLLLTRRVDVKNGARVFVFNVSDGVIDPYQAAAKGVSDSTEEHLRSEIETHLKANPRSEDFSRFLTERATVLGALDNTTVTSIRLDANTDLKGKSVTMAVFDGVGHEDGTLSSALARQLQTEVPGAEPQVRIAREEIDHVVTRKEDLARAGNPAAVYPSAGKPAADSIEKPPPKEGPGSDGNGGAAAKPKAAPQPAPHEDAPQKPAPQHEHPVAGKPPHAEEHIAKHHPAHEHAATRRPVTEPVHVKTRVAAHAGVLHGKINKHGGTGTGVASALLQLAEGDVKGAGINAVTQLAFAPSTYKAAAQLTRDIAPVTKSLRSFAEEVPGLGGVVAAGFTVYTVGDHLLHREYGKAGAEALAGTAETIGSTFGFGIGDGAREVTRSLIIAAAGKEYAPEKSGLRQLGEGAVHLAHQALDKPHQPAPAPSIYHYKNLPAVTYVFKDTPDRALNGRTLRTPDGHIKNLRDINFSDPKNLKAFEDAIHRRIKKDEQLVQAGKPLLEIKKVSQFLGLRTNTREIDDAKVELRQLTRALHDLQLFKQAVHDHHGYTPPAAGHHSQLHSGQAATGGGDHTAPGKKPAIRPKTPTPH
ncbi:MAG: hypothetical protein EPN97_16405 [Alphaproteobacteria bacterium]|nr:MAG: hypothetical protein EPN97_16405 [Alphaproteobacteria bacterium]